MPESQCLFAHKPAAVLRFSGEDQLEFLQAQGTADLLGPPGLVRYNLWLDHRGQIQGDGFVLRESEEHSLLVSYASPASLLREKFERHIIADDVEIEDCTAQYRLLSVAPADVPAFLSGLDLEIPEAGKILYTGAALAYHGRRLGPDTLDILYSGDGAFALPEGWTDTLEAWDAERRRIQAGIPLVPGDLAENGMNPVEAGILSAVSFTKGCYLGQEVVARVHRLDRSSRRLVRLQGLGPAPSVPGDLLLEGQVVGELRSVVTLPDNFLAMGWLKNRIQDGIVAFEDRELEVVSIPAS